MGQRIFVCVAAVIAPADDLPLIDNDTADGHFAKFQSLSGQPQRHSHIFFLYTDNFSHALLPFASLDVYIQIRIYSEIVLGAPIIIA